MVSTRKMDLKKLSSLVAFLWQRYNLLPIEKIMLFYCSFTFLLAIVFWNEIAPEAILNRIYLGRYFFPCHYASDFPWEGGLLFEDVLSTVAFGILVSGYLLLCSFHAQYRSFLCIMRPSAFWVSAGNNVQ